MMILIEENFQDVLTEAAGDNPSEKKYFLKGVFAESETKNRNGRIYQLNEMRREVDKVNTSAKQGRHVLGELDHPNTLDVKLKNVSHRITEMWMEGNKAFGKAEILKNHPNGQIAIGLMKDNKLIAGVIYENWNRRSIMCHIAVEGRLTRLYVGAIFNYAFNVCNVEKIIVPVESHNLKSIKLIENMGFTEEARIVDGSQDGDIIFLTMTRRIRQALLNHEQRKV
jgi:RimJ/RimL family protein N-acetyltransferase